MVATGLVAGVALLAASCRDWERYDPRDGPNFGPSSTTGAGGDGGAPVTRASSSGAGAIGGMGAGTAAGGAGGQGGMGMGGAGGSLPPVTLSFGERSNADVTGVTADTYVWVENPTFNHGTSPNCWVDAGSQERTTVLRFHLSTIPLGATMQNAELRIFVSDVAQGMSVDTVEIYEMLEAWTEGAQAGAAGVANYDDRMLNQAWTAAGVGVGSRGDVAIGSFAGAVLDTEHVVALPVAVLQTWVDDPADNFGLALATASLDGTAVFCREAAGVDRQPLLVVTYQP
jgi:hypothetical protein